MIILTLRTDKPEAEIGLYDNNIRLQYEKWQAHRELSTTIHKKIKELLDLQKLDWQSIEGLVVYKGPGSFTGLRIGFSVANALSYGNSIPIVSSLGSTWVETGLKRLLAGENEIVAIPEYGSEARTTKPKK